MTIEVETELHDDDDNTDLNALDRGDNIPADGQTPEQIAQATADAEAAKAALRDASGKFAKKPDPTAEETAAAAAAEAEAAAAVVADTEAAAAAAAAAAKADPDNLVIRHNKAMAQRDAERARADALEAQLRALQAAAPKPEPKVDPIAAINASLDELYTQVEEARADGDTKAAATLQRQIDNANREIGRIEAERVATRVSAVSADDAQYNALLDVLEGTVNVLNPKHEDFDPAQVKELDFQVAAYEKMGMSGPNALKRAVKILFREDNPFEPAKAPAAAVEPAKAPAAKAPDPAKAVDTQRRQPPDAGDLGVNKDSTKIIPSGLSDEDYDKLPESKKRELRGDFVTG